VSPACVIGSAALRMNVVGLPTVVINLLIENIGIRIGVPFFCLDLILYASFANHREANVCAAFRDGSIPCLQGRGQISEPKSCCVKQVRAHYIVAKGTNYMSVVPDPNWLNALKLPLRVMVGVTIACAVLLALDYWKVIDLIAFGNLTRPFIIVLLAVAGALTASGFGALIYDILTSGRKHTALAGRREIKRKEAEEELEKARATALERLDYLSSDELRYLADCLRKGSQSFTTWVHSSPASMLSAKGLIYSPGGTHHQDHYPFTIIDFVWKELLRRKEEILARDDANMKRQEQDKRRDRY
jgi:hypothetical protein